MLFFLVVKKHKMEVELESDDDFSDNNSNDGDDFSEELAATDQEKLAEVNRLLETESVDPYRVEEAIKKAIEYGNKRLLQYLLEDPFWKQACDNYCKTHRKQFIKHAIFVKQVRIANYLIDLFSKSEYNNASFFFAGVDVMNFSRHDLIKIAFSYACEWNHSYATDLIRQGEIKIFEKSHLFKAIQFWSKGSTLFRLILESHQIDPTSGYDDIEMYFPFELALSGDHFHMLEFLLSEDFMEASFQAHGRRINPGFNNQYIMEHVGVYGEDDDDDTYYSVGLNYVKLARYLFQDRLMIPKYRPNTNPDTTWGIDPNSPFQNYVLRMFARYGTKEDHAVLVSDSFRFTHDSYNNVWIGRVRPFTIPIDTATYYKTIDTAIQFNQPEVVQWWLDRFPVKELNDYWIFMFESAIKYGRPDNLRIIYSMYKTQYDLYKPFQQHPIVLIPNDLFWAKIFEDQKHELMVRMFDGFLNVSADFPVGGILSVSETYGPSIIPDFTTVMALLMEWGWVDQIQKVYTTLPSKVMQIASKKDITTNINSIVMIIFGILHGIPINRFLDKLQMNLRQKGINYIYVSKNAYDQRSPEFFKNIYELYQRLKRNPPDVDGQFIKYYSGSMDESEAEVWGMYYLFVVVYKKRFTEKLYQLLANPNIIEKAFEIYIQRGGAIVIAMNQQSATQESQPTSQSTSFQQQYRPDGWDADRKSWKQCVSCSESEYKKYETRSRETGIGNPCRFTRTKCNEHIGQSRKRKFIADYNEARKK